MMHLARFSDFRGRVGALCLLLCTLSGSVSAEESAFRLGPEDRVRIKVFEWRPSQDIIFEWKALNDEFIVSANGTLSVPLAGDVPATGSPPGDVARRIGERLKQRMQLAEVPDVSLSVVQYRPFFVTGDVSRPGSFPFHPGLTVLEAVATAGGVPRIADIGLVRLGREVIDGEGELAQFALQTDSLMMRRARLQAELAEAETIPLPSPFAKRTAEPGLSRIIENETKIFDTRRQAFRTQSQALEALKVFLAKETDSLVAQLGTLDTQMTLINKELAGVSSLVEKGMAVAPRQLALERSVAQIQGDRLNMQTGMLRVQAEISRTDIALIELKNGRKTEGSLELRDIEIRLDESVARAETRKRLLYETQITAPRLVAGRLRRAAVQPAYFVVREENGVAAEVSAGETTQLNPGDTVKVSLPLPDEEGDAPASVQSQADSPPLSLQ